MKPPVASPQPLCPACGTRLAGGACPACALGELLYGGVSRIRDEGRFAAVSGKKGSPHDPQEAHAEGRAGGSLAPISDHPLESGAAGKRPVLAAGEVDFGRYILKKRLASGGMGVVYIAEDLQLKRTVALKMIRGSTFANEAELARFTIEAEAAASLDHANIVPIYEVGRYEEQPFFTMKLIEGMSLAEHLRKHGRQVPARQAVEWLRPIAHAVHHAHQRGVLHRDLKPGNILLDAAGVPWLTDFGLAKLAHAETGLTLTTDHIGTPHYMSPEMAAGTGKQASTSSDVWALGVLLWEMLCGMPPFGGSGAVEILRRIVEQEPAWPTGARGDADLITLARRCMEKDTAKRPASAGEVAEELGRWLRGEPILTRRISRRERLLKWVRREPALAAFYVALITGSVAGLMLWQRAEKAVVSLTGANNKLEESLSISTALKLAGDARQQVAEESNRALLLAVEAVEMTGPGEVLPEAAGALVHVLQRAGGLDATPRGMRPDYNNSYMRFGRHELDGGQISPDNRWLLSLDHTLSNAEGGMAGIYRLKDMERGQPVARWLQWPGSDKTDFRNEGLGFSRWLPDSRRMLLVGADRRVQVLRMDTGMDDSARSPGYVDGKPEVLSEWRVPGGDSNLDIAWPFVPPAGEGPAALIWQQTVAEKGELGRAVWKSGGSWEVTGRVGFTAEATTKSVCRASPDGRWTLLGCSFEAQPLLLVDWAHPDAGAQPLEARAGWIPQGEFSPDSRHLVLLAATGALWLADLPEAGAPDGKIVLREVGVVEPGASAVAWSPDNRWIAVTGKQDRVRLIPLRGTDRPAVLRMTAGSGLAVGFSQDSQWLAAGGDLRVVNVWPMAGLSDNTPPQQLFGMPTPICGVRFSPDDSMVVAIGLGSVVRRWDLAGKGGGALPVRLGPGMPQVNQTAVSPDGKWVASAGGTLHAEGGGGVVGLHRMDGKFSIRLAVGPQRATGVAISQDGRLLAAAVSDGSVQVWELPAVTSALESGNPLIPMPLHRLPVEDIRTEYDWRPAFHPDGRLFLSTGDGVLFCWDLKAADPAATRQEAVVHSIQYLLPDVKVSPDGTLLAVARHGWDQPKPGKEQFLSQILLFDAGRSWPPKLRHILQADFMEVTHLDFSPDSRWLAAGAAGWGPGVWDLRAPDIAASKRMAPTNASSSAAVAFSGDSTRLAFGDSDGRIFIWNWLRPDNLQTIQTSEAVFTMNWLPGGKLVSAGPLGWLSVWETDIARLKDQARRVAGRALTDQERLRFRVPARR